MGLPEPLKTRPSMSLDTGVLSTWQGMTGLDRHMQFLQQLNAIRQRAHFACEFQGGALAVNAGGALKNLHHRLGAIHLQDLATTGGAISQSEIDNLCISWLLLQHTTCLVSCALVQDLKQKRKKWYR